MIKSESDTKMLVTTGPGITRIGTLYVMIDMLRRQLVSLSLVSSFASFGSATDENTVWDTKLLEVRDILRQVAANILS